MSTRPPVTYKLFACTPSNGLPSASAGAADATYMAAAVAMDWGVAIWLTTVLAMFGLTADARTESRDGREMADSLP